VCDCVTQQGLATSAGLNNKVARWSAAGVRTSLGQLTELSLALAGHTSLRFMLENVNISVSVMLRNVLCLLKLVTKVTLSSWLTCIG